LEICSILKAATCPNWGGSCKGGKSDDSGCVKSMMRILPLAMSAAKEAKVLLILISLIQAKVHYGQGADIWLSDIR